MWKWARTVAKTFVVLAASAGLMALIKFSMGGKLSPRCYAILVEFCQRECWYGRPFSTFPLACDRAADVVILALANLGIFVASACVSALAVVCGSRYCCGREQTDEDYARLIEENMEADPPPSAPSIRMQTMRTARGAAREDE